MKLLRLALCATIAAAALAACGRQAEVPAAGPGNAAGADAENAAAAAPAPAPIDLPSAPVEAVTVAANAVRVGAALGPRQGATGAKPVYGVGDTVYASLATGGRTGTAKAYWTGADGRSVKEEEKPLSGDNVNFGFSSADGMKAGTYNVEIDVDDVPAGITEFTVQ